VAVLLGRVLADLAGVAAILCHADRTSGGSLSLCLMNAVIFHISSSERIPSRKSRPCLQLGCSI
jgi:hypothetical protein